MSRNKVVIVGSTNVDKFINVMRFPKPGETLHIDQAQREFGGGKGANQRSEYNFSIWWSKYDFKC